MLVPPRLDLGVLGTEPRAMHGRQAESSPSLVTAFLAVSPAAQEHLKLPFPPQSQLRSWLSQQELGRCFCQSAAGGEEGGLSWVSWCTRSLGQAGPYSETMSKFSILPEG